MTSKQQPRNSDHRPGTLEELFENVRVAWYLFMDGRINPMLRFGIPLLVVVYVVSPIDLVPDLIPGLGQVDDIAAIWLGLRYFLSSCPSDIVDEHRAVVRGQKTAPPAQDPEVVEGDYRVVDD